MTQAPVAHSPPAPDEIEISLFGPGFGECSAVHVGGGKWVIIDSCLTDEGRRPAVLQYFEQIGVDPATAVSHVIISHPDNDHIGGISKVLAACKSADLLISSAYTQRDLLAWTALYSQADPSTFGRPTSELTECFSIAMERKRPPLFVMQDVVLMDQNGVKLGGLAPSSNKIHAFLKGLTQPEKSDDKLKPYGLNPNPASVVIHLEAQGCVAIFGGDLEEAPGRGWSDIMSSSIIFRKSAPPLVFKVPHHGSPNADLPALWAHFGSGVIAIMTNFNSGVQPRPSPEDVRRILGYTPAAYVCSSRHGGAPRKDSEVEKHLKFLGIKRRRRFARDGQIRIRFGAAQAPAVSLFGAASDLARLYEAA